MVKVNYCYLTDEERVFVKHIGLETAEDGCELRKVPGDHLRISRKENTVVIEYAKVCELYRGLALLKEGLQPDEVKEQPATLDSLGVMLDCSRNAVPTVNLLKAYVLDLAALGYDQLQLYTEDTFEIPEYPYFGHYRGRYTAEEIQELDAFARQYGVELVPAVQTLAHLNAMFRWNTFDAIHDVDDILLCDDEQTYEFLDRMMAALRRMYTTDKINVCMDEAHAIGLGQYLDKNGYHSRQEIFLRHMRKIAEIAKKYGFKPMMWSDMFAKIASADRLAEATNVTIDRSVIDMIPEEMSLICWNYWVQPEGWYDTMVVTHTQMEREVIFGGGFQKWTGFCPTTHHALTACRQGLDAVYKYGVRKALVTGWGDDGAEGSLYMLLPGLVLYAEKCYVGNMNDAAVDHRLQTVFGRSLADYYLVEQLHNIPDCVENTEVPPRNLNKILLWNDPLLGLYDRHILPGTNDHLENLLDRLQVASSRGDRLDYVFETIYYLCRFLSQKAELGIRLRAAYTTGDKAALAAIKESIPEMIDRLDTLHRIFRRNWLRENKIFGFDVQDVRFGTQRARLVYTGEVIAQYLTDEIDAIAELDAPSLYMDCRAEDEQRSLHFCTQNWHQLVTVCVL